MPEIVAVVPSLSCYDLFPGPGIKDLKYLDLIPSRLAGAMRAGGSPREAPAIRAGGRPVFAIPGAACPISLPGR